MTASKRLFVSLLFAALASSPAARAAENLSDFLTHGYRVASRTEVVGAFSGCEKSRSIRFRDKSVFNCNAHVLHNAYAPSVFILQTSDVPADYVVLIDGKPYTGSLSRILGKTPRRPIQVTATTVPPAAVTAITARPLVAATPLTPRNLQMPAYPVGED